MFDLSDISESFYGIVEHLQALMGDHEVQVFLVIVLIGLLILRVLLSSKIIQFAIVLVMGVFVASLFVDGNFSSLFGNESFFFRDR